MGNSLAYAKEYMSMVDRLYKVGSVTAILETDPLNIRASTLNASTIYLQEQSMSGLGDYNTSNGYSAKGDINTVWTPYTIIMDRARTFLIDAVEEKDARINSALLAAKFYREHVIPEIDAYRFERICSLAGINVSADLTAATVLAAVDVAIETLADSEVTGPQVMFISNAVNTMLKNSNEFKLRLTTEMNIKLNREVVSIDGIPLIIVPKPRFYTNFDFNAGAAGNEGGFVPNVAAKGINFILTNIDGITGIVKHVAPKLVLPSESTTHDATVFGMRVLHDLFIPTNKLPGVYVHTKA